MNYKVKVGISNHHIHLTKETYYQLFDKEPSKRNDLNQIGEYAYNETVTIKGPKGSIPNVRIMGPFRNYNQVEISRSDAFLLGLNPPVRKSGQTANSATITLISSKNTITLEEACIIANRHVHMNPSTAEKLNVVDNQLVKLAIKGDKSCILDAYIKISANGYFETHLDFDDANACGLKNNDEIDLII